MTLQNIRRYYETPIRDICAAATPAIPVLEANQLQDGELGINLEYVKLDLDFGETTLWTTCGNMEDIRGSFIIGHFSPKGFGPGLTQALMTQFMVALNNLTVRPAARTFGVLGTLSKLEGPTFTALDDTPYFYSSLSMAIRADWQEP